MAQMDDALNVRKQLLTRAGITGGQNPGVTCVERLMAAGKSREEAEAQCEQHRKNQEEGEYRDSLAGKIKSAIGK